MRTRELVGLLLLPLVLLAAAIAIDGWMLWSRLANSTLPWLCSAIAVAVLIVGTTSMLTGLRPSEIPPKCALGVWAAVVIVFGTGMGADAYAYSFPLNESLWINFAEWVGFAIILGGSFAMPRLFSDRSSRAS